MSFKFHCDQCGCELEADDAEAGTKTHCPGCGGKTSVPGERQSVSFLPASDSNPSPFNDLRTTGQSGNEARLQAEYLQSHAVDMKYASRRVRMPAICLIIAAMFGFVVGLLYLLEHCLHLGIIHIPKHQQGVPDWMLSGPYPICVSSLSVAVAVVLLLGSIEMLYLERYWLAYTVAILTAIPCLATCCCMPVGIWAIVVLNDPAVKLAFQVRKHAGAES